MAISKELKLAIIQAFYANGKSRIATKRFLVYHTEWGKEAKNIDVRQISRIMNNFESRFTLTNEKPPGRTRTVVVDKTIERVKRQLELSPRRSVRGLSKQLKVSTGSVWKILRKELKKYPYRIQLKQSQTLANKQARVEFANKITDKIEEKAGYLKDILFSDEGNFHISGHVNRQNMRFWGETNPHETIEGPKSKEKVIAWVGLSYECGVIGPFFFEDTEGKSDTVKTANYLEMIKKKVIPALKRRDRYTTCVFQQDGAPPHCSKKAIECLTEKFDEDRLISRNSSFAWPPYSPDLNPCDYYLWGYLKSKVYCDPYPVTTEQLKRTLLVNVEGLRKRLFKQLSTISTLEFSLF